MDQRRPLQAHKTSGRQYRYDLPFPKSEVDNPPLDWPEHAVYRFYGADDQLLYVGITWNPIRRWNTHARKARWFSLARRVEVAVHPTKWDGQEAELHAIRHEAPLFNRHAAVR